MSPQDNVVPNSGKAPLNPLWWILLLGILQCGALFLPIPNLAAQVILTVVVTAGYVGILVGLASSIARLELKILAAAGLLAVAALAWIGVQYGMIPVAARFGAHLAKVGARPTPAQVLALSYPQILQDLALISGAMFAGSVISRLVRHPNLVGPIGVLVALIDIWGVLFSGPVSKLLASEAAQPIASKAMAAAPKVGAAIAASGGGPPKYFVSIPDIGVGDYLFLSLMLCILVNLAMNWRTSARIMWVAVVLALLSITFIPWIPALPGLLFIGLAAVVPNTKHFTFTREEKFALLYAGIFVLIMTIGLYFGLMAALKSQGG